MTELATYRQGEHVAERLLDWGRAAMHDDNIHAYDLCMNLCVGADVDVRWPALCLMAPGCSLLWTRGYSAGRVDWSGNRVAGMVELLMSRCRWVQGC